MRLRTFTAPDMPTAMKLVREAMGDEAIILTSEANRGKKGITVTAALDYEEESPARATPSSKTTNKADTDHLRFELQNILRFHNVPELFMAKILQNDRELAAIVESHRTRLLVKSALEKLLGDYFSFAPLSLEAPGMRLMLVGPPGVGKTLTAARIATDLAMHKQPLAVITTDDKRAGGVAQLQAFTDILGIPLKVAATRAELWKHLQPLPKHARVIIDTAGCNPYDQSAMAELAAYADLEGVEPVLVLPAGGDSLEAIDIAENFLALPIKRLLVTRADTARRFGGVLAAAAAHGLAFSHMSNSPGIVDMLRGMDSAALAHLLLRYQLQTP